jgi:DNA-binding GntR family transcriptional regulator
MGDQQLAAVRDDIQGRLTPRFAMRGPMSNRPETGVRPLPGQERTVRVGSRATPWGAYKTIAEALRRRITEGEFPPGAPLPSEAELRTEYGVARNTLRRALADLEQEGLLITMPGRGRVASPPGEAAPPAPAFRQISADLRAVIERGELRQGDLLPSEATLTEQYGVSRSTVRQALTDLEGAGLIETRHGKGRFVK